MSTWTIDNTHSSVGFTVRHMVFAKVRGTFKTWRAELNLDEDVSKSSVKVSIDTGSVDTGVDQRDGHLKSPDFFDAAKFPAMTFVSRKVTAGKGDRFSVEGDLTIRDVTRPVTLEVEALGRGKDPWGNQRAGFQATARIDRREFGLTWNQALEAGGVLVGENVDIEINLQAVAQAEQAKKAS